MMTGETGENDFSVDKTWTFRRLIECRIPAQFITRPAGFGKTRLLMQLEQFLQPGGSAQEVLAGAAILQDRAFCDEWMGRTPVVRLSLRPLVALDMATASRRFVALMQGLARQFAFLREAPRMSLGMRNAMDRCLRWDEASTDPRARWDAERLLLVLMRELSNHYDRPAILLLDDADAPIVSAALGGFYKDMASLLQSCFGSVLKPNPLLESSRGWSCVLMGRLPVNAGSYYGWSANWCFNTVASDNRFLNEAFGFTSEEVRRTLSAAGLAHREAEVTAWCGGYRQGKSELCPPGALQAVCRQLKEGKSLDAAEPDDGLTPFLSACVPSLSWMDRQDLRTLLAGGELELSTSEAAVVDCSAFDRRGRPDFWSALLHAGCLAVTGRSSTEPWPYRVRLVNEAAKRRLLALVPEAVQKEWFKALSEFE